MEEILKEKTEGAIQLYTNMAHEALEKALSEMNKEALLCLFKKEKKAVFCAVEIPEELREKCNDLKCACFVSALLEQLEDLDKKIRLSGLFVQKYNYLSFSNSVVFSLNT